MIPRKIHTVWTKDTAPTQIQNNINSLRNMNKSWSHVLWTPRLMRGYIEKRHKHWLYYWDRVNPKYGVVYADIFRYIIMNDAGGVYLDAKSLITVPLDRVFSGFVYDAYIHGDRYRGWAQWFLISEPGHPFLEATLRRVFRNLETYSPHREGVGRDATLNLAGPTPYTQGVNECLYGPGFAPPHVQLSPLPHWLVYDTIGSDVRQADPTHYNNQSEPLLWP